MKDPKRLQSVLEAAAPPDMELTFRAMFGGIMSYANGAPFASLSDVGLALKLHGRDHAEMLALPGAVALRYGPDEPASKTYVVVPDVVLADRDESRGWIVRSVAGLKPCASSKRAKK